MSKGHAAVREQRVYKDRDVVKKKRIGHMQKRVGKDLRDLKHILGSKKLAAGKLIEGRRLPTDKESIPCRLTRGNLSEAWW